MSVQVNILRNIAYFAGLSQAELESIAANLFEKTVERGGLILSEGEKAEVVYFVAAGLVKIFKTSKDGKEQILNFARPGGSFNDATVFGDVMNLASASAVIPVSLYGIKKADLIKIIQQYPKVAWNALGVCSRRVQQLVSLVEDLSFRQVTGRVAKILLEYAHDDHEPRAKLTQQEMAAMAGTAREMVGRALRLLAEEGLIRL